MSWWLNIIEYMRDPENGSNGQSSLKKAVARAIAESVVDLLYYVIGLFTTLYFLSAVYLFFKGGGIHHNLLVRIFDALSEPYFGSVGIYVILKEIRKRQLRTKSRHFGEYFVYFWLFFFLVSLGFTWFSPNYIFDDLMASIMTITLALIIIYIGGVIHKP
jgi:hypothetical protein